MIFVDGATLYHGSYVRVDDPDLAQCRGGKDFGRGFYLTSDLDQARRFVRSSVRKAESEGRIAEGSRKGFVSRFKVENASGLSCLEFARADEEWLACVVAHRRSGGDAQRWRRFDVIEGKIANDNTNVVISAYLRGLYGEVGSSEAARFAIGRLFPENLKDQACLRTEMALARIRFCGSEEVAL